MGILWHLFVEILDVSPIILPAPSAVLKTFANKFGLLMDHALFTLTNVIEGFLLSVVLAFALGAAIAYSWILKVTLYPLMVIIRSLPIIAIAPFLVIWIGYGSPSILAVSLLLSFFPIVIATISGLTKVDPDMVRLMRSLKASEWLILRKLRFKNALPYLFDGYKVAITLSIVGVIVGEFIASVKGLGYIIVTANYQLDIPLSMSSLLVLTILSLSLFGVVLLFEKLVIPWHVSG